MLLPEILKNAEIDPSLTMVDVGARPTDKFKAPFHKLSRKFKSSRVLAFDADAEHCEQWNGQSPGNVRFYPYALGRTNESRSFNRYRSPEHSSFYPVNLELAPLFHGPDGIWPIDSVTVETVSLDWFLARNGFGDVDFLKADVQGAELEVLQGGITALADCLMLVLEVTFIPIYKAQPLFEDITLFLRDFGFLFHKFIDPQKRPLKPMLLGADPHIGSQLVFADAIYMPHPSRLLELSLEKALRAALLSDAYESYDWAYRALKYCDHLGGSKLAAAYQREVSRELGLDISESRVSIHQ